MSALRRRNMSTEEAAAAAETVSGEGPTLAARKVGTPNYLTPYERQAVEDFVPQLGLRKWRAVDVQWAFRIAYWSALRMSEVITLRARSFDYERRTVYLRATKNRSNLRPVPGVAVAPLQVCWRERVEDVGDTELLQGCTTERVYRWLRKIGEALDIPALTTPQSIHNEKSVCHAFRKSAAKDMLWGTHGTKATIDQVQAQLGHSNPVVSGAYLRMGGEAAQGFWDQADRATTTTAPAAPAA